MRSQQQSTVGAEMTESKEEGPEETSTSQSTLQESPKRSQWRFLFAFLSLVLMVLVVSLDATTLPVALPVISRDLDSSTIQAFWASLAFILPVAITQPLYMSFSDIIGRKFVLWVAYALFAIGSIVFAVAPSMDIVILGRVIQGLGGGGLDILNEIILADITTLKERPKYIGLMGLPLAAGTIAGPIIGAAFAQSVTWRWIGWINLPIVGASAALALVFLQLKFVQAPLKTKLFRVDWTGMALLTVGLTAFSIPLSIGGTIYSWSSWRILLPLIIGAAVLSVFVIFEKRPEYAVFPYRIFRQRSAKLVLIGSFLHGVALYPLILYVPLYFQSVHLETVLRSGVSMLPVTCTVIAFAVISGVVVEITRRYRTLLWVAWICQTLGVGLLALWNSSTSVAESAGFQIIGGIGMGTLFTIPPLIIQASVDDTNDQGIAVGILVCFRFFGALLGLAVAAAAFTNEFGKAIVSVGPLPPNLSIEQSPSLALSFIPSLRTADFTPETLTALQEAYLDAMRVVFYIVTGFSGLGLLSSMFVTELSLESEETGRQALEHDAGRIEALGKEGTDS